MLQVRSEPDSGLPKKKFPFLMTCLGRRYKRELDERTTYNWEKELDEMRSAVNGNIQLNLIPQQNMTNYNPGAEYDSTGIICGTG